MDDFVEKGATQAVPSCCPIITYKLYFMSL